MEQEVFKPKLVKHTLFPFNLVPTVVEVTDEHVLVTHRQLFGTSQQTLIPMQEIHNCEVHADLFSEMLILSYGAPSVDIKIARFRLGDAKAIADKVRKAIDESQKQK